MDPISRLYGDRFIRAVNYDVYHFGEYSSRPITESSQAYSSFLTKTLCGFDPQSHPSIFSRPAQQSTSPFALSPIDPTEAPPPRRQAMQFLSGKRIISDAPDMSEIGEAPSRPMDALGPKSFVVAIAKSIYIGSFLHERSQSERTICSARQEALFSHVTVFNRSTGSFAAATTAGTIILFEENQAAAQIPGDGTLIVDMFKSDPSTLLYATRPGCLVTCDLRAREASSAQIGSPIKAFACHPKGGFEIAAATIDGIVKVYDARRSASPAKEFQFPSVSALTWHPSANKGILFVGHANGDSPMLAAVFSHTCPQSLPVSRRAPGIIRSIVCGRSHDCLVTVQDSKKGHGLALWHWDSENRDCLAVTQTTSTNASIPSSAVMERDDDGVLIAYPEQERFVYQGLQHPVKVPVGIRPPDPYALR
jgi:hypothetical protein